jgi:hypothetical protein
METGDHAGTNDRKTRHGNLSFYLKIQLLTCPDLPNFFQQLFASLGINQVAEIGQFRNTPST